MAENTNKYGTNLWTVVSSNIFAAIFSGVILWVVFHFGQTSNDTMTNLLLCLLGALIGWGVGIFASPYDLKENERFLTLGRTISAFISGYLVSKLDRFLEVVLYTSNAPNDIAWVRLCLFAASFLLSVIVVFINRLYFNNNKNTYEQAR